MVRHGSHLGDIARYVAERLASIARRRWRALFLMGVASALSGPAATSTSLPVHYPAQPATGGSRVCVSSEGVYCFAADTLAPAWTALRGQHTLEPVIAQGRVLIGTSRGVYAFASDTGRKLWRRSARGLMFTPTVAAGTAYVSDRQGHLAAVDAATGELRWQRTFDGWSYPPAVMGEVLVTGGRSGIVRGLDRRTGATRWRHDAQAELVYRPIAAGGRALVTTFDGQVLALGQGGAVAWRKRDAVASLSPAVAGTRAVFAGIDGTVRARALEDGRLLWRRTMGAAFDNRPRAHGGSVGLVDGDGRAVILRLRDGAARLATNIDGRALGSPAALSDGRWTMAYRDERDRVVHRELLRPSKTSSALPLQAPPPDARAVTHEPKRPSARSGGSPRRISGCAPDACDWSITEEENP